MGSIKERPYKIGLNSFMYLSGGGDEKQSFSLDGFFLSNITTGGKIAYIPIALKGHRLYEGALGWFTSVLALHNRTDIQITQVTNFEVLTSFDEYDAIYIGGGNTWLLQEHFLMHGVFSKLRDFIATQNKNLYGGSAGAIILGNNISCQQDGGSVTESNSGASLVGDYSLTCHFNDTDKCNDLLRVWVKQKNLPLLALSEDGGLIVNSFGELLFVGGGHKEFRP